MSAFKQKIVKKEVDEQVNKGTTFGAETPEPEQDIGLFCMHGIHSGTFALKGKTVAEARAMLAPQWNIDPATVGVIAGEVVPEDSVIGLDTDLLTFVKQAAVKGVRYGVKWFDLRTSPCLGMIVIR